MTKRDPNLRMQALTVLLLVGALGALDSGSMLADDRDFLREQGGNPYLFVILDTSSSMNLELGGMDPTVGYGDDPASRIYQAKSSMFEVFSQVDGVNLGFASFNQDRLHVRAKHYLYYASSLPGTPWPSSLGWPTADPDGLTFFSTAVENDVDGDVFVFGATFVDSGGTPIPAGTCPDPIDIDDTLGRKQLNSYAKLGENGSVPTTHWINAGGGGGTNYRLVVKPQGASVTLGAPTIDVTFELTQVPKSGKTPLCGSVPDAADYTMNVTLQRDAWLNETVFVEQGDADASDPAISDPELEEPLWPWSDAPVVNTCGTGQPHSGLGWEGNYDGRVVVTGDPDATDYDIYCNGPTADPSDPRCVDLKVNPMQVSALSRNLDSGDLLPLDWNFDNHLEFLQRLAPNYPEEALADFRITPHLEDAVDPLAEAYLPKRGDRRPLVAAGHSPIQNAIIDWRCWYLGTQSDGPQRTECASTAFTGDLGWSGLACNDPDDATDLFDPRYGCRRPYVLVITDGEATCSGNNPGADLTTLENFSGILVWILNVGDPSQCQSGNLSNWASKDPDTGDRLCFNVSTRADMISKLNDIVGFINQSTRSFAAAAVPSVQRDLDRTVIISSFRPLNDSAYWEGHFDSFKKPAPQTIDRAALGPNHVWDSAAVMLADQYDAAQTVGVDAGRRRIYYSGDSATGQWPLGRRLMAPITAANRNTVGYDLWRGFGLIPQETADDALPEANEDVLETGVNAIIAEATGLHTGVLRDSNGNIVGNTSFLLGDVFHSNPLIVGDPENIPYFVRNVGAENNPVGATCQPNEQVAGADRGYRCFQARQALRRRVAIAGFNDGLVHAFNAGQFDGSDFTTGTGHELWAYMPRAVFPVTRLQATGVSHKFSVDGSIAAADVFIDPVFAGVPNPTERRWRTVAIGGLREGGAAYYALDITSPDPIDADFEPPTPTAANNKVAGCHDGVNATCGGVKYPAALWEFTDASSDSAAVVPLATPALMDEDDNGVPDLGDAWSIPNIGRIRSCKETAVDCTLAASYEDRYVAVFGGGMDPQNKFFDPRDVVQVANNRLRGNWLYMVDIETGKVLYKRQVLGAAASEPAAVDTNQDGYLDRIYQPTISGLMYRVDLLPTTGGELPQPKPVNVTTIDGRQFQALRITTDSDDDPVWVPKVIFSANYDGSSPSALPRSIYHRPSVVFVAKLGFYALAFGTGDREDLWSEFGQEGRFYAFVDDTDLVDQTDAAEFPLREDFFVQKDKSAPAVADTNDFLVDRPLGRRGWSLAFSSEERLLADPFSLSGVTIFASFVPNNQTDPPIAPTDVACGEKDFESVTTNDCLNLGTSNLFIVNTTNANGFVPAGGGAFARSRDMVDTIVSNPFSEVTGVLSEETADVTGTADELTADHEKIMETLRGLFPENCKFINLRVDVKVVTSDAGIEMVAPVPVCTIERNWKEF